MTWYAIPTNANGFTLKPDKDNTDTNGQNYSASVAENENLLQYMLTQQETQMLIGG